MACKLPSVTIDGGNLSDLFFNYELPNYRGCSPEEHESKEDFQQRSRECLHMDAVQFVEHLGTDAVTAVELVNDFVARE